MRREVCAHWVGQYFDGLTARTEEVHVAVTEAGLVLTAVHEQALWPYDEIRQTQGYHRGKGVHLERGETPAQTLIVSDLGILRAMRLHAPGYASRFYNPATRHFQWPIAIAAVGVAVLSGIASLVWGLPALIEAAAIRIPPKWEQALGQSTLESMAPESERCHGPAGQAALDGIVARLLRAGPSSYRYQLIVTREAKVNAFAAPGGFVVVFRGLLNRTKAPEELAGVLAHEIEHVEQRHATKALLRELSFGALVGLLGGDSGALQTAIGVAGSLAGLKYRRQEETAADIAGMRRLMRAGVDTAGMINFFGKLETEKADTANGLIYLSSHPRTVDRIAVLRKLAANNRSELRRPSLLDVGVKWEQVRQMCK